MATLEEGTDLGHCHACVYAMPLTHAAALLFHIDAQCDGETVAALQARLQLPARPAPDLVRHRVLQPVFTAACQVAQVSQPSRPCIAFIVYA